MTPVTYHMTTHSSILNIEKPIIVFKGVIKMRLMKSFLRKIAQFLWHLAREYVHPCFYADEKREAQLKKAQVCYEVREIIKRHQLH